MSFIAKNPLTIPVVTENPPAPKQKTRGLFAKEDGWYDIDAFANARKLATEENANNAFANALKGDKLGNTIVLNDVSPIEHTMKVTVRSKNIARDVKCIDAGADAPCLYANVNLLEKGKIYTLSFDTPNTGVWVGFSMRGVTCLNHNGNIWDGTKKWYTFAVNEKFPYDEMMILYTADDNAVTTGLCSNVMIEEGEVATNYTPHIEDLSEITIRRYGENLFDPSLVVDRTIDGITTTAQSDGGILFVGSPTADNIIATDEKWDGIILQPGTYSVYGNYVEFLLESIDGEAEQCWIYGTVTLTQSWRIINMAFNKLEVGSSYNELIYPGLYKEDNESKTYMSDADGIVEGVTSLYPVTSLVSNTNGEIITVSYNRDINSMGTTGVNTDSYTKEEADSKFQNKLTKKQLENLDEVENKATKSTTLLGYGIKDAYTKEETEDKIDEMLSGKPLATINLDETVPKGSLPSICDFEFKPYTPFCLYSLANSNLTSGGKFAGREIPLLTTKGDLKIIDSDGNVKFKKYIEPMIGLNNRAGWTVFDTLTQNGLHRAWSKKFYLTMNEYATREEIDYGGAKNAIHTFEFDESDFAETGIPAKLDNIPVVTPCFVTGSGSTSWLKDRLYGNTPFPMKFSYNPETKKYIMTIRSFGEASYIFYELNHWSKTYIHYQLETPYDENNFLAMGLEDGDKITFENDYSDLEEYFNTSDFLKNTRYGDNVTELNAAPTITAKIPQNTKDALSGFSNAAKIFNEGQSAEDDVAQDYSWIGDGDGITDYTTIIQNKIKELSTISNGGTVFLGNGTYKINKFIELYDNIKLIGTGNTVIKQTDKNSHALVVSGSNITIRDLSIQLYQMTKDEKDNIANYNTELTACVYINSNNAKTNVNYNSNYKDNIYCRNLLIDNVHLIGSYSFNYANGAASISNDYEHYRGCGLISGQLYFNYATITNVHISGMYHGLHNIGGSNDITVFCTNTKVMMYGGGGYADISIYGHTYYDTDSSGNTISMSDTVAYCSYLEQSRIAEYIYDVQWMRNIFIFDGYSMNNRYIVSQIGGGSYYSNDNEESGRRLEANVIDYGRGNRPIENYQNTPYHVGSKFLEKTGMSCYKANDPITQNALSGAGIWGTISSNDSFDKGQLDLSEVCRYPKEADFDSSREHTTFMSAISNGSPSEENPIEIIIDISERPVYSFPGCFIQFDNEYVASDFSVSFDVNNTNTFVHEFNVTGNTDVVWSYMWHQKQFYKIYKLKIVITKALYIENLKYQNSGYIKYETEYNPNKLVGICNIGMIDADFAGRAFLGECGGNVYGDLLLNKNSTIKNVPIPIEDGDVVPKKYIDENIINIYNKNIVANALKEAIITSEQTITLTDVSPIEHDINIKILNKNLAYDTIYENGNIRSKVNTLYTGKTYTMSFYINKVLDNYGDPIFGLITLPTNEEWGVCSDGKRYTTTFTMNEDRTYENLNAFVWFGNDLVKITQFQIEEGSQATEYVSGYAGEVSSISVIITDNQGRNEEIVVTTEGTSFKSSSPNTILTNIEDVQPVFSIIYNKDINFLSKNITELTSELKEQTETMVKEEVAALVDSAPDTLDTLNELAQALGEDPNFAATMTEELAKKAPKATTLAGYNIRDAYTKNETDNAISNGLVARAKQLFPISSFQSELQDKVWVKFCSIEINPNGYWNDSIMLNISQNYGGQRYGAIVFLNVYRASAQINQLSGLDITQKLQFVIDIENNKIDFYIYKTKYDAFYFSVLGNTSVDKRVTFYSQDFSTATQELSGGTFATYYSSPLAQKATADADGNIIADTYVTKNELQGIETALDNIIAIQNNLIGGDSI